MCASCLRVRKPEQIALQGIDMKDHITKKLPWYSSHALQKKKIFFIFCRAERKNFFR